MIFLSFSNACKFFFTIFLLFVFTSVSILSQTRIKERVGINSKKQINKSVLSKQSSQVLPCGPFDRNNSADTLIQVIWTGSTFPVDPDQQPQKVQNNASVFYLADSMHYDITIIEGAYVAGFREYYRNTYDFFEIGSSITNALGIELKGDSPYYVENCYWSLNQGFIKYFIHFSDTTAGGTVVCKILQRETGITKYIKSILIKETFRLTNSTSIDSLKHNHATDLGVQFLRNECPDYCIIGVKPKISTCTFEITSGSEFGVLRDGVSGIKDSHLVTENTGDVSFMANGVNPDSIGYVIIRVTSDDQNINPIEISFRVLRNDNPPPSIIFEFDKNVIAPGDTVNVTLKFRKLDNTIEDFLPDRLFDISIFDGVDFGILYSPDIDSYDYTFYDVRNSFKFISNNNIAVDSAKIILRASAKVSYESIYQSSPAGMMIGVMFIGGDTKETIRGTGEFLITNKSVAHVKAYFDKPNLAAGDTANIIIKKVDSSGNETDYPLGTLFEVAIIKGCGVGLINGTSAHLTGIQQPVKFVVADSVLSADTVVVLRVGAPDVEGNTPNSLVTKTTSSDKDKNANSTVTGISLKTAQSTKNKMLTKTADETSCTVYTPIYTNTSDATAGIDQTTIKITLTGKSKVWPYKTSGNPITNAKIKVTSSGQPMANQRVKITIKREEMSGGHDHPNSSDLTLWGRISVNGVKGNPVTTYTDQNGEIITEEIRSSEFSGEYIIEAALESKPSIKDNVPIVVKVPGLSSLSTSTYYELVGSPENYSQTNDPCRFQPPGSEHRGNHFGTQVLKNIIMNIASDYVSIYPGIRIRVNDMSLENGGLFDYQNSWSTPHKTHRVGDNADIPFLGINSAEQCINLNRRDLFNAIMDYCDREPFVEGDHYHIYSN